MGKKNRNKSAQQRSKVYPKMALPPEAVPSGTSDGQVTDTTVQDVDILVGSDGDSTKGNVTRNYTVGSLKTHMINSGVDASFGRRECDSAMSQRR